jgi:hypothetical protein
MREKHEFITYTLELDDLAEDTTPKDLRLLFSKYGHVFFVRIDSHYEADFDDDFVPQSKKVSASVTMPEYHAARARKKLHGCRWRGKTLNIGGCPWRRG